MRSTYAIRRPVVNAYLVRERDRRRVRELAVVLLFVFPLGLGLLAYTWLQLEVLRTGYRIERLERRSHELAQSERQLRLEAAYLANPERISSRAQNELGLTWPRLDQLLFRSELP